MPTPAEYPRNGDRGPANENPPPWHSPLRAAPEPAAPAAGVRRDGCLARRQPAPVGAGTATAGGCPPASPAEAAARAIRRARGAPLGGRVAPLWPPSAPQ